VGEQEKGVNANRWLRTLESLELAERPAGRREGPIGMVGLELARRIAQRSPNGVCEASPGDLAASIARARSAVTSAIARLRASGFLAYSRGAKGRKGVFRMTFPPETGHDGAVIRGGPERDPAS
jgi:DNA-binding MarR family transcriptional regulator